MKDSWFTSMIFSPQVKLLNFTLLKKRKKLSISSEVKSSQKEKLIPETIPTAGTGTLIRLNKNFTCQFVSHLLESH